MEQYSAASSRQDKSDILSAIVNEYVQLCHPGYGFNYKMETEVQDKKPLAHQGGMVTNWSNGRLLPRTTYERTQIGDALRRSHLIPDAAHGIIRNMVLTMRDTTR